jgi:pimeloyl-ACP methyl ester carboxylesterase
MSENTKIEIEGGASIKTVHKKPRQDSTDEMARKLVVMIHGFPGDAASHNNLYGDLEFILNDKGFHTLRFDFLCCGESAGNTKDFTLSTAKQTLDVIKAWAQDHHYEEFIFISDGFGSLIALLNMEINVTCQVLLWPGLNPQYLAKHIFKIDEITETDRKFGYITHGDHHIGIQFIDQLNKLNLANYFRDITMPVLIMHGSADEIFPIEHLNIIRQRASSKRIEITTFHDAAHGLPELKHRKSMFFHILQFLEKFA